MTRRRWIIIGAVLIVLVVAFIAFGQYRDQQRRAALLADLQTTEAQLGSLIATVGATGVVRANQTASLFWGTSGTVETVYSDVGDLVSAGDVLADLKQSSLPQSIILAQADLVSAQQALEDLNDAFTDQALAPAKQAVANAQKAVEDAERVVTNLSSPAPRPDIEQAEANVILAADRLDEAQDDFDPYVNKPDSVTKARLQSALAQAQMDYDDAVRLFNNLSGIASQTDQAVAEADLEVARQQLLDAQEEYERLLSGPDEDDVAAAEARIAAAEATLALAWLEAPFAGIITQVEPLPGDQISPNALAFRLDDLSRLLVDVEISEIDVNRLQVGQPVTLTFDAILAREYAGEVAAVSPVGTQQQGVVNFLATIELLDADEDVKPGMTAAVNVVVSELQDVLLVPNRAVRVQEGRRVVYTVDAEGELATVPITLGASSDEFSEVVAGELELGDLIVLNPPTIFEQQGPPPFAEN